MKIMMQHRPNSALIRSFGIAAISMGLSCMAATAMVAAAITDEPIQPVTVQTVAETPTVLAAAEGDIVDVATAHGAFQSFTRLLDQLGMAEDLRGYGRFTVFAPTDAAFQSVPQSTLDRLLADRELMAKVLAYHVVSSGTPLSARDLRSVGSLTTLERSSIELNRRRGRLYINEARVVEADIAASNGVIHAIDQVLIPPDVARAIGSATDHRSYR